MQSSSLRQLHWVRPSAVALGCSLYALEFSAFVTALALYRKSGRPLREFFVTQVGFVFLASVVVLVISSLIIVYLLRSRFPFGIRQFAPALLFNVWSVFVLLAVAEVVIRLFTVSTPVGAMFANTLLFPRSWEDVAARNRAILAKALAQGSYLVYDSLLGWTIGRSRRNEDGLYFSSVEGIRSPRVDMAFADVPAKRRIAIVGDSFAFGLEVPYEDTWGHQLELALGPEYQVLNFGVDGYGVDQAYLRYQRDVIPWRPETVILGIINDDVIRTMGVYGFLKFLDWEMPFPKPRFVVRGDSLAPLNLPLPTPDWIFARETITELPFIDYDSSFQPAEWERRFYDNVYLIRFLLSRFPRWPIPGPAVSNEALKSVNGKILRSFLQLAREKGSMPIVLYFPSKSDFISASIVGKGLPRIAKEILRANDIPYLDMTGCVSKVSPVERFVTLHYSSVTNSAIAKCLTNSIRQASRG